MRHKILILLCSCIICASVLSCMVHPITLEREFNIVGEQKELSIGKSAHPEIVKQFGYYHNQDIQRYVSAIGKRLVEVCARKDIDYHFTVLDDEMINAFAVPGGYIYVTRGLLAYLNSEAELAGVLGHEIGHIVGRDSAALMSQSMVAQIATLAGLAGAAASSSSSGASDLAMATNQLFNAIMLGYSREREYLADEQSVEYLYEAGYDPVQVVSFMRTLSYISQGPTGPQQYLVTHPFIFDRIDRIEAKCKVVKTMRTTMQQINEVRKPAEHTGNVFADQYKHYLDGLVFGPKDSIRHIKLYTVRSGDTFPLLARRTMGSAVKARQLAVLNGLPVDAQLIPGATVKLID